MMQSGNFSMIERMMPGPLSGIPIPGTGTKENPQMMPPPGLAPPQMIRMLNGGNEPPDIARLIRESNTPTNTLNSNGLPTGMRPPNATPSMMNGGQTPSMM
jgi:hypothetical protein